MWNISFYSMHFEASNPWIQNNMIRNYNVGPCWNIAVFMDIIYHVVSLLSKVKHDQVPSIQDTITVLSIPICAPVLFCLFPFHAFVLVGISSVFSILVSVVRGSYCSNSLYCNLPNWVLLLRSFTYDMSGGDVPYINVSSSWSMS